MSISVYKCLFFILAIFFQTIIKILYQRFQIPYTLPAMYLLCIIAGIYIPVLIAKTVEKFMGNKLRLAIGLKPIPAIASR